MGEIVAKLAELILSGKSACQDIYATCLKQIITEVNESYGITVIKSVGEARGG